MSAFNKVKLLDDIEDIQAASMEFSRHAAAIKDKYPAPNTSCTAEQCATQIVALFVHAEIEGFNIAEELVKKLTEFLEKE